MKLAGVNGKVWLITCDCRALARALAEAVLASGHKLVATAVDREPLRHLSECYGDQLRIVPIDVIDALTAESAIRTALGAFGRLDVVVMDFTKWQSAVSAPLWLQDHLHRAQVLATDPRTTREWNTDESPLSIPG